VTRLWTATSRAVEQLFLDRRRPLRAPIWRRHLEQARERTVFEGHVERVVGPLAGTSLAAAPGAATRALTRTLLPHPGEGWGDKLRRSRRALRNASVRRSDHIDTRGTT
jgi:hypothetical protein